ncbi:MAG TPA: efflux transporter periplasmic adaptor subunit, partial [Thermoanaerobaculia bacterium]|nr:efflux transporter periplasmic adaptor subunit [Thermoanaerobaculia bacterium]
AVSYAPYGNSVFVVGEMKAPDGKTYKGVRQQFVKLGGARGDQVAVLSGVKAGEEVVTSGVFKLRSGAGVVVNNKVQPSNNPAPKPEDS